MDGQHFGKFNLTNSLNYWGMENDLKIMIFTSTAIMLGFSVMVASLIIHYQKSILKMKLFGAEKNLKLIGEIENKERTRISRELHDGVCGDLAALHNLVSVLEHSRNEELKKEVFIEIKSGLDLAYKESISLCYNLAVPSSENRSLHSVLERYIERMNRCHSITFTFDCKLTNIKVLASTKLEIYRITQELVQNIIKHSRATKVSVTVQINGEALEIYIQDNGSYFHYQSSMQSAVGMGLQNISTRVLKIKANLQHKSSSQGNKISLKIPLNYD